MREHCPDIPCVLIANKIDGKIFIKEEHKKMQRIKNQ